VRRQLAPRQPAEFQPADRDASLVGPLERADHVQQRRLAGARRSLQRDGGSVRDLQRDLVERHDRLLGVDAEAAAHVPQVDHTLTGDHIHRNNAGAAWRG
jgi:hypothetical protein